MRSQHVSCFSAVWMQQLRIRVCAFDSPLQSVDRSRRVKNAYSFSQNYTNEYFIGKMSIFLTIEGSCQVRGFSSRDQRFVFQISSQLFYLILELHVVQSLIRPDLNQICLHV